MNPAAYNLDYLDKTYLHPVGALVILLLVLLVLVGNRRWAMGAWLLGATTVSIAQRVAIGGLDLHVLRICILVGWIRVFLRGEIRQFQFKPMDLVILLWFFAGTFVIFLLHEEARVLVTKAGRALDILGMYFLTRVLIRDREDFDWFLRLAMWISIPMAFCFLYERMTGHNLFSALGGVSIRTPIRDGRLRCMGPFVHPIIAGIFWAGFFPLFGAQWFRGGPGGRMLATCAMVSVLVIVVASNSSTPVAGILVSFAGASLWFVRRHLRWVRWGVVVVLAALHFISSQPVWHLLARVDLSGSSTGWHRFRLIDACIAHFSEWWLLGVRATGPWGKGLADITNQYVLEAVTGGLWALALFLLLLVVGFRGIGRMLRNHEGDRDQLILAWGLGVALLVHTFNFLAISYFGQMIFEWFFLLAVIGSLTPVAVPDEEAESPYFRVGPGSVA